MRLIIDGRLVLQVRVQNIRLKGHLCHIEGATLALVSGILFTGNNFVINQSSVSVSDVVLVRTVLQLLVYSVIIWARAERILPNSTMQQLYTLLQGLLFYSLPTLLNCSSGLTGAVAFICSLACVSFMAVPDALCIIFACPVVTILLSAVMLRDKLNLVKVKAIVIRSVLAAHIIRLLPGLSSCWGLFWSASRPSSSQTSWSRGTDSTT